jgi:hypothetical protein
MIEKRSGGRDAREGVLRHSAPRLVRQTFAFVPQTWDSKSRHRLRTLRTHARDETSGYLIVELVVVSEESSQ